MKANENIDKNSEKHISEEAKFWREVLKLLIKIILCLTAGNTALKGNKGKANSNSEGIVKLMAEFDPILSIKYLNWKIQKELIKLLAAELRKNICEEIKKAQCFSIIVDSTQDITKIDQVSVILRYIVVNYNEHNVQIKESFLGFYALMNYSAEGHFKSILDILKKYNLDVTKCRLQGYDGASVMSGAKSGVQKRIFDIVPSSLYVHCTAHNLNLVIADVAKSSLKISTFFDIVQNIYLFFSQSAPRWASLAFGDNITNQIQKKVCNTRWETRDSSVYALKKFFINVLKSLTNISLTIKKSDELNRAKSLLKKCSLLSLFCL